MSEDELDAAWSQHRDALIAEAARDEFTPYWLHKRRPVEPGAARWRQRFLDTREFWY